MSDTNGTSTPAADNNDKAMVIDTGKEAAVSDRQNKADLEGPSNACVANEDGGGTSTPTYAHVDVGMNAPTTANDDGAGISLNVSEDAVIGAKEDAVIGAKEDAVKGTKEDAVIGKKGGLQQQQLPHIEEQKVVAQRIEENEDAMEEAMEEENDAA